MTETGQDTLVICGHGMVAQRLLEELVGEGQRRFRHIVVFNGEPAPAYNRIQLSALLAGETDEPALTLKPASWFQAHGITVHHSEPVWAINRAQRTVTTATGRVQPYHTLVLATGARPSALGLPGEDLPGVMTFRDLQDARALIEHSRHCRRAVVVGGGFLGLEAAEGLRQRGLDVTVLHRSPYLLNRQLDETGGQILSDALRTRGLTVRTGTTPIRFLGRDRIRAVQLTDETLISTDLVVIATGITPNHELAQAAGLACDRGVQVDARLQTSDPQIYALGECCQFGDQTYGLVEPGYHQARALAQTLSDTGSGDDWQTGALATRLKISGLAIFACGENQPDHDTDSLIWRDLETGHYGHLLVRDQRLVGAILVGDTRDGPWYQERIEQGDSIAHIRAQLPFGKPYCEAAA